MKVNGNQKNGNEIDSKESKTDLVSKKAVAVMEDTPLKSFNAAETWKKLSNKLGKIDKGLVTWGLAMAASFSLLVAANIHVMDWNFIESQENEKHAIEATAISKPSTILTTASPIQIPKITAIVPAKTPAVIELPKSRTNPPVTQETILLINKKEVASGKISPLSNPFVSVFGKVNFESGRVAPEIGVDFKIAENYTAKRREIYKIGMSSQFNYKTSETGDKQIHPHTFVNLEYTTLNKKTNKGWTSRAGFLLNPDGQLYQDTTIKVSLFRSISKHLKVGPEVIFTNNMKQAYPSISLILG